MGLSHLVNGHVSVPPIYYQTWHYMPSTHANYITWFDHKFCLYKGDREYAKGWSKYANMFSVKSFSLLTTWKSWGCTANRVFTESAPRPIQSISFNVCLSVCLSDVQPKAFYFRSLIGQHQSPDHYPECSTVLPLFSPCSAIFSFL